MKTITNVSRAWENINGNFEDECSRSVEDAIVMCFKQIKGFDKKEQTRSWKDNEKQGGHSIYLWTLWNMGKKKNDDIIQRAVF